MTTEDGLAVHTEPREPARRGLTGSLVFAFALGAFLLYWLMLRPGGYGILAFTRVLWLLNRAGIVPFDDHDTAILDVPPALEYHLAAQDPVDWTLVFISVALLIAAWGMKALQFNGFTRFAGISGTFGPHARAYLYGNKINMFFPYKLGNVSSALALEGQGASPDKAALVVFMGELFTVIEIIVFAFVAWVLLGFTSWIPAMVVPSLILLAAYMFVRRTRQRPGDGDNAFQKSKPILRALVAEPALFGKLIALSLASFFIQALVAYFLMQAFQSENVFLGIEFKLMIVGMVGANIARLIPVTPGGLGQFELGFVQAVAFAGSAGATTVVLAYTFVRYLTAGIVFLALVLGKGAETSLDQTFRRFKGETSPGAARTPQTVA